MDKVAITIGALLILLGVGGFVASGSVHYTALIPAYFGIALAILGVVVAIKPAARKHAMHAAAAVALLGALSSAWHLVTALLHGSPKPLAVGSMAGMIVLCLLFVLLAVRSFIAARKAREAGQA